MRRINKDLADIPATLVVSEDQLTHQRRKELIRQGKYIDEQKYNSRYKTDDIKEKLDALYHHKCAFCEIRVEQGHVEHYRPKQQYYWLAYSWDNLIYGCPTCNQFKGTNFEIKGKMAAPPSEADDLSDINTCSSQKNDQQEKPMLLNPERDNLNGAFLFDMGGHIKDNNNDRADYTIRNCNLNREYLVDSRRKIINDFRNKVISEFLNAETKEVKAKILSFLVEDFINSTNDETQTFTAFRKAAIDWLDDIVKDVVK